MAAVLRPYSGVIKIGQNGGILEYCLKHLPRSRKSRPNTTGMIFCKKMDFWWAPGSPRASWRARRPHFMCKTGVWMAPEEAKIPTPVLKSAPQPLRIHVMRLWQKIMVFGFAHGALESKPRRSHVQRWRSARCVMDLGGLKSPRRSVMVVIIAS